MNTVVAEVVRSGVVESRHRGTVVQLAADGSVEHAVGDPDAVLLARSCLKPLQSVAMLRAGLDLDGELLALATSSHSGEPFHLDGVRRILAGVGLDESALQCPVDLPLQDSVAHAWLRSGGEPERVLMDCSGKHAAMLATCVTRGWDPASYLDPEHPLQQVVAETVADLTGVPVEVVATDGCGAPLLSTTLTGLARAFARIARAAGGAEPTADEHRVAEAIRAHPQWVSGTDRDERRLIGAVPGAIAKSGAEGCYAVALADGRAFALRIEDGAARARPVVMAALLVRAGVDREPGVDGDTLRATGRSLVLGGGLPVGEVRATLE